MPKQVAQRWRKNLGAPKVSVNIVVCLSSENVVVTDVMSKEFFATSLLTFCFMNFTMVKQSVRYMQEI